MKSVFRSILGLTALALMTGCSDSTETPMGPRTTALETGGGGAPVQQLDLEYVHIQVDGQADKCIVGNNGKIGNDGESLYGGPVTFAEATIRQNRRAGTRNIFLNFNEEDIFFEVRLPGLNGRTFRGTASMSGTGSWPLSSAWEPGDDLPYQDVGSQSGPDTWQSHATGLVTHEVTNDGLVPVAPFGVWCSLTINRGLGGPVFNSVIEFDGGVQNQGKR